MRDFLNEEKGNDYFVYSLYIIAQSHIFHWLTENGQEHESIGEFYTILEEEVDNLAERYIGKHGIELFNYPCNLDFSYSKDKLINLINNYNSKTNDMIKSLDPIDDASIVDSCVDVKELIDKLIYKLRLA